jgi:hypothetical protein
MKSLKPVAFVLAVPTVMAVAICPPIGVALVIFGGLGLAIWALIRRDQRKMLERHNAKMRRFYARAEERRTTEGWTNPGWRL